MVNVVIALPGRKIGEDVLKKIRDISHLINLQDATPWIKEERAGNLSHEKELNAMLGNAEVLLAIFLPRNLIKRAPKLKWIQMTFVGMEHEARLGKAAIPPAVDGVSEYRRPEAGHVHAQLVGAAGPGPERDQGIAAAT